MLEYKEALRLIQSHTPAPRPEWVALENALARTTARPIVAREPFPHFDNSAVDGYALRLSPGPTYEVRGEVAAGGLFPGKLSEGEAVRIFTGAPVPRGADAVVMQEVTERANGQVRMLERPVKGGHIRKAGEDFAAGKILVRERVRLGPAHLALLAAAGHARVSVFRLPDVSVIATGDELVGPGERRAPGKIRDCNTILVSSLVRQAGGRPRTFRRVKDDPARLGRAVRRALASDILIIAGGVSVGKYDFVKDVLAAEGVREIFWKVNIKPGKPVYFGKKGKTLVFGLPGNPVSACVTFEEFVKPALVRMLGQGPSPAWSGTLIREYRNGSRPHFLRVAIARRGASARVRVLDKQGSHQIGALAEADGILFAPAGAILRKGQTVRVKPL